MARLKLGLWDSAISDCENCLQLQDDNMKANYYLTQAHLELRNYDAALHYALCAHKLCVQTNDRSMPQATALVLRCKKERWDAMEKKREREGRQLEEDILALLKQDCDEQVATCPNAAERREIEKEYKAKMEQTEKVFNTAREKEGQRRVVPDWAIDEISFAIFVDPVMVSRRHLLPIPFASFHPFHLFPVLCSPRTRADQAGWLTRGLASRPRRARATNAPLSWSTSDVPKPTP